MLVKRKECKMSISPIGVSMPKKQVSFKGCEDINGMSVKKYTDDEIKEAIVKGSKALEMLADNTALIAYTMYAIEKSKTASNGYHTDCFAKTSSPKELVEYANTNWQKPRY